MRQNLDEINTVLQNHNYSINTIICDVLKKFNFKTICWQSGASKSQGFSIADIITIMLLIPIMLLKSVHALYRSEYENVAQMKKDAIYRLKNNEKMPWRRLLYGVSKKFKKLVEPDNIVAENSAFIVDDTIDARVGYKMENISVVHDHSSPGRKVTRLGFKKLFLGFFDGKSIIPLGFSIHMEKRLPLKKRKKQYKKNCSKNSNGAKRRKECKIDKITNSLAMIKRAVKNGFKAKYALTDSWFTSLRFIKTIREIKNGAMHVIGGIKRDKRKYVYGGESMDGSQLLKALKKGAPKRNRRWNTRYYEVVVQYPGIGDVKLYICRFPYQKTWRMFISTDVSLSFVKMMEVYSARWTIEVMFRELKQHLHLGRCQSRDFDAQIANMTVSAILYIFLSYYKRISDYATLGGLLELIKDEIYEKNLAERIWELFDELLQVVIDMISRTGAVDIGNFRQSVEYQCLRELFEESFLSNQVLLVNKSD